MKNYSFIVFFTTMCCMACVYGGNTSNTDNENLDRPMTDEEKQAFINKQFEEGAFLAEVTDYVAFELTGNVKLITNTTEGEFCYVPYPSTSIEFGYDGRVCGTKYENKFCNHFIDRNINGSIKRIKIGSDYSDFSDMDPEIYCFSFDSINRITKVEVNDDWAFGKETNDYYYNEDHVLYSIFRREQTYEGGYTEKFDKFRISDVKEDIHHNWVERTLTSNLGRQIKENRKIIYHNPPTLIPIANVDDIYCYCQQDYDNDSYTIKKYNPELDAWNDIIEEVNKRSDYEYRGVGDYKVVGSRLYVMMVTGACGAPGNDYNVCYLDIKANTWHFVIACNGDSEFVDNKIKAHVFWLTKEGECTAENEYGDSIAWINM